MPNYKERRNNKIKDLLNQIKKKLDVDETNKIEQIIKNKSNDELYYIIDIEKIKELDYSEIFTKMYTFLKLDNTQKGGERQPYRTIFRSQYNNNSDVGEEYIDIEDIIENENNATDLRRQLVAEQQLIQQEIQERNANARQQEIERNANARQQEIERNAYYQQAILSAQPLFEQSDIRTRQDILQIYINHQQQQQLEQQERNSMAIENQDEHIQRIMGPIISSIEDDYQQETKKMEEELRVIMAMAREEGEEDIINPLYPRGRYSILDIFKICYGCLFIIQRLIPFDPILAVIFAPMLLLILVISKLTQPQVRGGKKNNKRKTKKRKSNRNKLKKNLKKKTKKVKKVKKTKSKK